MGQTMGAYGGGMRDVVNPSPRFNPNATGFEPSDKQINYAITLALVCVNMYKRKFSLYIYVYICIYMYIYIYIYIGLYIRS